MLPHVSRFPPIVKKKGLFRHLRTSSPCQCARYACVMQLSDDSIREFAALYEQEFHQPISIEQARLLAAQVMRLYEVLARALPKEQKDEPSINFDQAA